MGKVGNTLLNWHPETTFPKVERFGVCGESGKMRGGGGGGRVGLGRPKCGVM